MDRRGVKESGIDSINNMLWADRFNNAPSVAKEAVSLLKKCEKAGYSKGIAYAKLNISAANFLQSKNDIALKYLAEAINWFSDRKDEKGYVRSILLKGNIFESFGDYEKTLSLWLEAYNVSRTTGDRESEGESASQLGLIYSRLCDFRKSLEYLNKGLNIRKELGDENGIASSFNRLGMVSRQMKKYSESLEYYFLSLGIRKRNKQFSAIPWTLLGIANTYEEMELFTESLEYYEKGMIGSDERCILQCLLGSGRVYSKKGEPDKAESRLNEALKMTGNLKSLVLTSEVYSALAGHFELSGEYLKALRNFKQYLKARESYESNEARIRLSNIEVANAIEKSEQEKEIYRLRHVELKHAYDLIEEKNRDITSSINYARRIQNAILPDLKEIRGLHNRCFVLYIPKAIVSGDFYWFCRRGEKLVIAAGDCTGHGVPGALMSMLGISFLEEIVNRRGIIESGSILNELRREIQYALHQKGTRNEAKDGMDISLCVTDRSKNTIQYSGAFNNLYLVREGQLIEYRADRMPIGIFEESENKYTVHNIGSLPGDMIYMFSDGFADQFGGPENKKFRYSSLKAAFVEIHKLPVQKQKQYLERRLIEWKGDKEQIDDVLIVGFRI
jgi:serine phosphatase RsbU (regulator of sigma subunit)